MENTQTSSNPESGNTPLNIVCFDPENKAHPCPICGGMGRVKYNVPLEHPRFGKMFRCPNYPAAADTERQERLRKVSNLNAFQDKVFATFEIERGGYSDSEMVSLRLAYNAAFTFAQIPQGWLLLEGAYGSGKTHLAAAVGNYRLAQGDNVLFITVPDLLDHLRAAYSPTSETTYDENFERVKNASLLILDDLGVENPSAWAQEKLFQLLNHRYSYRVPTIITTNADIDTLDGRIRSRLLDLSVIHRVRISAPDYRSMTQNKHEQLNSQLHLYEQMTFESFDARTNATQDEHTNLNNALKKAWDYAQRPHNWLLLMGRYGSGKTHLAAAIAQHRQNQGDTLMFVTTPDLMDYLKSTFEPSSQVTFDKLFNRVRSVPLLILDGLDTSQGSAWAKDKLFQLLDYRYITRQPTVITTAQKLEMIDERLQTRLADIRICDRFAITARSYADRLNDRPSQRR
jgi:DNA replication protein DnaC